MSPHHPGASENSAADIAALVNPVFDAVILAGGRGRRMNGLDKPAQTVGGTSLIQRAVRAVRQARRTVVVGPVRSELDPDVVQVRESPAGSGPVAAIAAGVSALADDAGVVVVLASDLPFVDEQAVTALLAHRSPHPVVFGVDDTGRTQYLFGAWSGHELRRALTDLVDTTNASVSALIPEDHAGLHISNIGDCDTLAELADARERTATEAPTLPVPTVDQARELIRVHIGALEPVELPVADAVFATLARPVVAGTPLPAVDISAMDGYAVHGPGPWTVRDEIAYAGASSIERLDAGDAVRIATGAQVPAGTTSVVRDEFVARDAEVLRRRDGSPVRDDTRRIGDEWNVGTELAPVGTRVTPAVVSVASSGEVERVTVRGPVTARIVISGNEIRPAGPLGPGQTRDSLGPVLPDFLRACAIRTVGCVHTPDTQDSFADLLAHPGGAHVVVVVGATGGGAADRLRTALARADARIVVERVQVRPGGSQLTAVLPDGTVVLGLPGNPLAAVGTLLATAPAIVDALTARTPGPRAVGLLADYEAAQSPTTRIVPAVRDGSLWRLHPAPRTAHLLNLVDHDALALIPPFVTPGEAVELLPLPR